MIKESRVCPIFLIVLLAMFFLACLLKSYSVKHNEALVRGNTKTVNIVTYIEPSRGSRNLSALLVLATEYTAHDPSENGLGITATGTKARVGECAVDPEYIPMGTVLWVPGYGIARAEDTGGAIKGYHIDLFVPSKTQAMAWGKKLVTVTILSMPSSYKRDKHIADCQ